MPMQLLRDVFFYFIVYSFFGWMIEGLFHLCTKGSFIKPNFLILPFKPMYGITATLLIYLNQYLPFWIFLICALVIPTLVEYLTAYLLSHLYHLKYWDYSQCPHQYKGYICLRFSIYWFFLSVILTYELQPLTASFYGSINHFWHYCFPIALFIFMIDFIVTLYHKHLVKSLSSIR